MELTGVLLSRLKPLLRQHWDPEFDEHAVSYFNESGTHVSIKKMKHLLAELVKWTASRKELVASNERAPSALDEALQFPISLTVSHKNNDFILCCERPAQEVDMALTSPVTPRKLLKPSLSYTQRGSSGPGFPPELQQRLPASRANDLANAMVAGAVAETQYLRAENMELKRRLQARADEIYKLKAENLELKSCITTPPPQPAGMSTMQPVWITPSFVNTLLPPIYASPLLAPLPQPISPCKELAEFGKNYPSASSHDTSEEKVIERRGDTNVVPSALQAAAGLIKQGSIIPSEERTAMSESTLHLEEERDCAPLEAGSREFANADRHRIIVKNTFVDIISDDPEIRRNRQCRHSCFARLLEADSAAGDGYGLDSDPSK
jgi:hypothetical protein